MELFDKTGHLTDEGLKAVVEGSLGEMGRLEAGEHLGYCDACMERYTALLTEDVLVAPRRELVTPVLRRIRQKKAKRFEKRYGTAVAAACLAVVLFGGGSVLFSNWQSDDVDTGAGNSKGFVQQLADGFGSFVGNTQSFLDGLLQGQPEEQQDAVVDTADEAGADKVDNVNIPKLAEPPAQDVPPGVNLPEEYKPMSREEREALFKPDDGAA